MRLNGSRSIVWIYAMVLLQSCAVATVVDRSVDPKELYGNWIRGGDYQLIIKGSEDKVVINYINPSQGSINVGSSRIEKRDGKVFVSVTLNDVNYSGSTYNLFYDPASDTLTGEYTYTQGTVPVVFTRGDRKKSSRNNIELVTDDLKRLVGSFHRPPHPNAPGIVLMPDTRCDSAVFSSIAVKLNEAGFAVLALDFRYKDIIAKAASQDEAIQIIQRQDLRKIVEYDVKRSLEFICNQEGVNPNRICLVGTSLGSRIALLSGARYQVKGLVLISLSGEEAIPGGESIKILLENSGDKPILFVSSENDWGGGHKAAQDNRRYVEWTGGKRNLKIWSGGRHGVELISGQEHVDFLINWIQENI